MEEGERLCEKLLEGAVGKREEDDEREMGRARCDSREVTCWK